MSISIIAAIDMNLGLGFDNQLLCHLPNDLKRFKELTTGHFVVMGRKTYESIGNPLPNRTNIILTRDEDYVPHPEVTVYHSINKLIKDYNKQSDSQSELFVCGGGEIYEQFLPLANKIYLTIIEHEFKEADVFFPSINLKNWKPIKTIKNPSDKKHEYAYSYVTYIRKTF